MKRNEVHHSEALVHAYLSQYLDQNMAVNWPTWIEDQRTRLQTQRPLRDIHNLSGVSIREILDQLKGVSYQEVATSAFVSDVLLSCEYNLQSRGEPQEYQTEIIASRGNPKVYVRVDLDAVSLGKQGSTHACGHSTNMSSVLEFAQRAAQEELPVGFIFQPAEEGPGNSIDGYVHPRGFGGGQYLREKGVYENIPLLISCHIDTSLHDDEVRITAEQATAAAYRYTITSTGKPAHAALPWQGINPVEGMYKALSSLFQLNTKFKELATIATSEYGLVTPTQIHTIECELNSLAPSAEIRGISRISGERSLQLFRSSMESLGAKIELEAPPVFNDPELARIATHVAKEQGYAVQSLPARFRDETAWAGPLTKPWVENPQGYAPGCENILHFFTPNYNSESGGLHSQNFLPNFPRAIETQVKMLYGIVKKIQ